MIYLAGLSLRRLHTQGDLQAANRFDKEATRDRPFSLTEHKKTNSDEFESRSKEEHGLFNSEFHNSLTLYRSYFVMSINA